MADSKPNLIFTSAGDSTDAFFSWLDAPINKRIYSTAVVYYGKSDERWERIKSSADYSWRHLGFVWTSFVEHNEELKGYNHYLIVDDDLKLEPAHLNDAFNFARKNKVSGLQFSKDPRSWGVFTMFHQQKNTEYRKCNFIEQCFMMLSSNLTYELVDKWRELGLSHVTAVDIVLANLARERGLLPFINLDKYKYYNPHPKEKKKGRELQTAYKNLTEFDNRVYQFEKVVKANLNFFQIGPENWMRANKGIKFSTPISVWTAKTLKPINKDKTYTIIKISDRFDDIVKQNNKTLKNWNYVNNIEFFNAKKQNISLGLQKFNIKNSWETFPNNRSPLNGEFGCFFSHLAVCEYIVENNLPWMVVLEDDALVTKDFSNILDTITNDKDLEYDFISLWDHDIHKKEPSLYVGSRFVQRSYKQQYGTIAMLYSYQGAQNILNMFKKKGFYTTYDVALYNESRACNLNGLSYISFLKTIVKHYDKSRAKTEIGPNYKRKPLW